uniref:Short coiled-coil protein n=1 Tax=Astatotilapia calliptera TaxID=8154 RepID=A0AAX7U0J6_ASTCA
MNCDIDGDMENQVEVEEKTRLINQVLELQHTLEDLSARVDAVKEENLKLKSENQVLGQYIENLMSASSVFQTTDTKSKRKVTAACTALSEDISPSLRDALDYRPTSTAG